MQQHDDQRQRRLGGGVGRSGGGLQRRTGGTLDPRVHLGHTCVSCSHTSEEVSPWQARAHGWYKQSKLYCRDRVPPTEMELLDHAAAALDVGLEHPVLLPRAGRWTLTWRMAWHTNAYYGAAGSLLSNFSCSKLCK